MKSVLIWLLVTALGAGIGYGLSWLTGLNLYICIGIGAIIGSSIGVTANIHRDQQGLISDHEMDSSFDDDFITPTESDNTSKNNSRVN